MLIRAPVIFILRNKRTAHTHTLGERTALFDRQDKAVLRYCTCIVTFRIVLWYDEMDAF